METLLANLPEAVSEETLINILAQRIEELIATDFNRLAGLLYRIDINEQRLQSVLRAHPEQEAGRVIAKLILDRQREKKASRARFQHPSAPADIPEDERW